MKRLIQRIAFLFVLGISTSTQAYAQTNDYHVNEDARRLINNIIAAYGGFERLTNVSRMMSVMQMNSGGRQIHVTLYETRQKIRREILAGRQMIQTYDGTNGFVEANGHSVPAPEALTQDLRGQIAKGVMQASLVVNFTGTNSFVKFLGKMEYESAQFFVIQTHDAKGQVVEHYFDPANYREFVEITKTKTGDEIQRFDEYKIFKGIFYPKKTTIKSADGRLLGGMELVKISDDFDDLIFQSTR